MLLPMAMLPSSPHSPRAGGSQQSPPNHRGAPRFPEQSLPHGMSRGTWSRANTSCHTPCLSGTALPGAAVPPKFGAGSWPSKRCPSTRQWSLTHAASAHTSNRFLRLGPRGKTAYSAKTAVRICLAALSHCRDTGTQLCQSRAALGAAAQSFGTQRTFYLQLPPLLALVSSSCCWPPGLRARSPTT